MNSATHETLHISDILAETGVERSARNSALQLPFHEGSFFRKWLIEFVIPDYVSVKISILCGPSRLRYEIIFIATGLHFCTRHHKFYSIFPKTVIFADGPFSCRSFSFHVLTRMDSLGGGECKKSKMDSANPKTIKIGYH